MTAISIATNRILVIPNQGDLFSEVPVAFKSLVICAASSPVQASDTGQGFISSRAAAVAVTPHRCRPLQGQVVRVSTNPLLAFDRVEPH